MADAPRPLPESEQQRHRALASPVRSRILAELRGAPGPLDVRALAARIALHPNTAREHLTQLTHAGLVSREPAGPAGRGRPAFLYRAAAPAGDDLEAHRALLQVLADELASRPGGREAAIRAGERWGASAMDVLPPRSGRAEDQLIEILDGLGFSPERVEEDRAAIRLHRCPFGSLAREQGEVICGAHLGLMRGALRTRSASVDAVALEPFVKPNLCIAHLGRDERPD